MVFSRQFTTAGEDLVAGRRDARAGRRPTNQRHRAIVAQRRAIEHQRAAALDLAGDLPLARRKTRRSTGCRSMLDPIVPRRRWTTPARGRFPLRPPRRRRRRRLSCRRPRHLRRPAASRTPGTPPHVRSSPGPHPHDRAPARSPAQKPPPPLPSSLQLTFEIELVSGLSIGPAGTILRDEIRNFQSAQTSFPVVHSDETTRGARIDKRTAFSI